MVPLSSILQGGKPDYPKKTQASKGRTNNKFDPYMALGWN